MDDWRSSPSQLKNFPRVVVFKKKKSDILSEWRGCVRLGRKARVSRQKRETWYLFKIKENFRIFEIMLFLF